MSGVGMDEASRGGLTAFWLGVAALFLTFAVGAGYAWSMGRPVPWGAQLYVEHVRALKREGQIDEAMRELEAEMLINRHDMRAPLMLSKWRAELGRPGSIDALEYVAAHTFDPRIHIELARSLTRVSRVDEADVALENALLLAPGRVDVHLAAGQTWEEGGRTARARDAYQRALELDPQSADARRALELLDARTPPAVPPS